MKKEHVALFHLDELVNNTCRTFRVPDGQFTREIFAVFRDDEFFVYENSCPHTGVALDWMPNQFLNIDKTHIMCSTHGALFRIEDGFCVYGPCSGQSLKSVEVTVEDGVVRLFEGEKRA